MLVRRASLEEPGAGSHARARGTNVSRRNPDDPLCRLSSYCAWSGSQSSFSRLFRVSMSSSDRGNWSAGRAGEVVRSFFGRKVPVSRQSVPSFLVQSGPLVGGLTPVGTLDRTPVIYPGHHRPSIVSTWRHLHVLTHSSGESVVKTVVATSAAVAGALAW